MGAPRATPFGQRHGDVEQAPMFGPLPQVGASLNAHGNPEQDAVPASMSAKGGPPRPSWNFCKVPAYLPGREKPFPMPPGLAPRLPIQAKLKVGAVDDPLEHEADRVADQVMRMPAPGVSVAAAPPQLSRKCAECEKEDEKLQRKEAGPQAAAGEAPAIVHEVLRSPGHPLDEATRAYFEPRFGHDFSGVRVHTDADAAESATSIKARAFTSGQDIFFRQGEYKPSSQAGQALLAHELTHVVQQKNARQSQQIQRAPEGDSEEPSITGTPDDAIEMWKDVIADRHFQEKKGNTTFARMKILDKKGREIVNILVESDISLHAEEKAIGIARKILGTGQKIEGERLSSLQIRRFATSLEGVDFK